MKVAEALNRCDLEVVSPDASLLECARLMLASESGMLPVCDGRSLLGIVCEEDLLAALSENDARSVRVRDLMKERFPFCFDDEDAEAIARLMLERGIPRMLILSRSYELVGAILLPREGEIDEGGEAGGSGPKIVH